MNNRSMVFKGYNHTYLAKCKIGSMLYGLADENSDEDTAVIYVPSFDYLVNQRQSPYHSIDGKKDVLYIPLYQFVDKLFNSKNMNFLEVLHSVLSDEPSEYNYIFIELLNELSKHYASGSFYGQLDEVTNKLKYGLENYSPTYHTVRILMQCRDIISKGILCFPFEGDDATLLLKLKNGERVDYEEIEHLVRFDYNMKGVYNPPNQKDVHDITNLVKIIYLKTYKENTK